MRRLAPLLFVAAFACGPGTPSGDDEVGDDEIGDSESGTSETDSGTSETDSGSSETDSGSSETDAGTETGTRETGTDTETGEPPKLCPLEPGDPGGLWTLPCGPGCSELDWHEIFGFRLDAEGSQLPTDILDCGSYSFEGTVIDHPSVDTWVIDACPCDADCVELDPHTIDFAVDVDHPAPELLPGELGGCVRVDVQRGDVFFLETLCAPVAVALWSLDEPEPRLTYAQGNHVHPIIDANDTVELGPLTVSAAGEVCADDNGSLYWTEYALRFDLEDAELVVPHQALDTLVHESGDYEARNVANFRYLSEIERSPPELAMWSLRPL